MGATTLLCLTRSFYRMNLIPPNMITINSDDQDIAAIKSTIDVN